MRRTLTSALTLALFALPLVADEPKKSDPPKAQTTASAPAREDSPLVAASKRMNRLGRKPKSKFVITNETLKRSGDNAHITTTDGHDTASLPRPLPPPSPTPERVAAKAAEGQRKAISDNASAKKVPAEERFLDDDESEDGYRQPKPEPQKPPRN